MVRLTLDRGERCALTSRCEDGNTRVSLSHALTNLLLDFAGFFSSPLFLSLSSSRAEASLELVRRELRERKQTTHCCLALCGAPWLPRHWSGALDGDIDNAHCSGDWDGEIG